MTHGDSVEKLQLNRPTEQCSSLAGLHPDSTGSPVTLVRRLHFNYFPRARRVCVCVYTVCVCVCVCVRACARARGRACAHRERPETDTLSGACLTSQFHLPINTSPAETPIPPSRPSRFYFLWTQCSPPPPLYQCLFCPVHKNESLSTFVWQAQ